MKDSTPREGRHTGADGFRLASLHTPDEIAEVETLQRMVWPGSDIEVVPGHLLLTAAHNGGLVAGAWMGSTLAGFVFGFPGLYETDSSIEVKHCSHMLGVHPDYRNSGIGAALKRYQREFVREQDLTLITWTFDPLLARNAHLNIAKLGATSKTYLRNVYGPLRDGINAGLPSDRLQVDWWLDSARVRERLSEAPTLRSGLRAYLAAGAVMINAIHAPLDPVPPEVPFDLPDGADCLIEIPRDFNALKSTDAVRALAWRLGTRASFEYLFCEGYQVSDLIDEAGRCFYLLTRSLLSGR